MKPTKCHPHTPFINARESLINSWITRGASKLFIYPTSKFLQFCTAQDSDTSWLNWKKGDTSDNYKGIKILRFRVKASFLQIFRGI